MFTVVNPHDKWLYDSVWLCRPSSNVALIVYGNHNDLGSAFDEVVDFIANPENKLLGFLANEHREATVQRYVENGLSLTEADLFVDWFPSGGNCGDYVDPILIGHNVWQLVTKAELIQLAKSK